MPRHNNEPDLDTNTGLPRKVVMKMVWKVAVWSLVTLQSIVIWMMLDYRTEDRAWKSEVRSRLDDFNTRMSRMEGKVGIIAAAPLPNVKEVEQVQ